MHNIKIRLSIHTALSGSASIANVTLQDDATSAAEGSYLQIIKSNFY